MMIKLRSSICVGVNSFRPRLGTGPFLIMVLPPSPSSSNLSLKNTIYQQVTSDRSQIDRYQIHMYIFCEFDFT